MKLIFTLTTEDVQMISYSKIGRRLTEEEMEKFEDYFNVSSWVEDVYDTLDSVLED